MKIELDLSRHCIETAIKKAYNKRITLALKASFLEEDAESEIEVLKCTLECFDFPRIRSRFPELIGGSRVSCYLVQHSSKQPRIEINKEPIDSDKLWKKRFQ